MAYLGQTPASLSERGHYIETAQHSWAVAWKVLETPYWSIYVSNCSFSCDLGGHPHNLAGVDVITLIRLKPVLTNSRTGQFTLMYNNVLNLNISFTDCDKKKSLFSVYKTKI